MLASEEEVVKALIVGVGDFSQERDTSAIASEAKVNPLSPPIFMADLKPS
jgi:hypothetical protein